MKLKRYDNIDILKTFAIFCVIFIHCYGMRMDFWESGAVINYVYYFSRTILATSVPLFLLCNGFLLFGKELNMREHIARTVKYFILTYLWGIITIFCGMYINNVRFSLGEIVNMFRAWQQGWLNHLWFMGALVRVYMLFPVLKVATERKKTILIYILILIFIFVVKNKVLDIASFVEEDNAWLASVANFDPFKDEYDWAYFYFCLGGVLGSFKSEVEEYFVKHRSMCNMICSGVLLVACVLLFITGSVLSKVANAHWDVVWEGYDTIFSMCAVVAIYVLSLNYEVNKEGIVAKTVRLISTNTLGIYFVHMIFIHIWNAKIALMIDAANMGTTILCTVIVLGMSLIVTLLMKKVPIVRGLVR